MSYGCAQDQVWAEIEHDRLEEPLPEPPSPDEYEDLQPGPAPRERPGEF